MKKQLESVSNFHSIFQPGEPQKPEMLKIEEAKLRHKLMEEENKEYLDAVIANDLIEVADALGDQLYILVGTILKHGMRDLIEEVFDEIHRSNLSKTGKDGKPIIRNDGKVLKGPNYSPPNLKPIIEKYL